MKKIVVIGGGFSGLSTAWALANLQDSTSIDYKVEVYEKTSVLGGLLQSQNHELGLVEPAANAVLLSPGLEKMAEDFGMEWATRHKAVKKKWLMNGKKISRWPMTWWQTFKNLDILMSLAKGSSKHSPVPGESVRQWAHRIFRSTDWADLLIGPALQGIYAGDMDELSASLCLQTLFDSKKISHKGSYAPKAGMRDFFIKGQDFFKNQKNFQIFFDHNVVENQSVQADWIVDCRPNATGFDLNHVSVTTVSLFWKEEDRPPIQGFGCLFANESPFLGVTFDSDVFEGRAKSGFFSERWILRRENGFETKEEIIPELLKFRQSHFFPKETQVRQPQSFVFKSYVQGIPYYNLKLEKNLEDAPKKYYSGHKIYVDSSKKNIIYHGNYLGDLGLNKIHKKSEVIAEYILENL